MREPALLYEAVERSEVKKLRLRGVKMQHGGRCGLTMGEYFDARRFARCGRKVVSLEIRCGGRMSTGVHPLWRAFRQMRWLREIAVSYQSRLPGDVLRRVRRLDSVKVRYLAGACEVAMKVGNAVTELEEDFSGVGRFCDEERLRGVARACPRLRKLAVYICTGAEVVLKEVVKGLPMLEVLDVMWPGGGDGEGEGCRFYRTRYPAVVAGSILDAVRVGGRLRELRLPHVRVGTREMVGVVEELGDRLRMLTVSVADPVESAMDKLEMVLNVAGRKCPNLRILQITEYIPGKGGFDGGMLRRLKRQGGRMMVSLERLVRRAPFLCVQRLRKIVESLCVDDDDMEVDLVEM